MSAPTYDKRLTASKNLRKLLAALSVPSIAAFAEDLLTQLCHYIYTTALALEGTLSVAGVTTLTGKVTLGAALVESVQILSIGAGGGAIDVITGVTKLTTTAAGALTLADGVHGQVKKIVQIADGGDATLTPTTKTGFTTIVFGDVGDAVILTFFTTQGWMVTSNNGATVS